MLWEGMFVGSGLILVNLHMRSRFFHVLLSIAGAVGRSTGLLFFHEAVTRVRWTIPPTSLALQEVTNVVEALEVFRSDCGRFPTQDESLNSLVQNPGIEGWRCPYVKSSDLIDPWGHPLHFRVIDSEVDVWSVGKDGQDGTRDDIRLGH
jgi:general secretion pathway protein G